MKCHFTKLLNLISIFMVWGQNRVEIKYSTCLIAQSCPILCDPMDCSPPGSSVHGILQARILEWAAMPSFQGSSDPGIKAKSPELQADSLLSEPPGSEVF